MFTMKIQKFQQTIPQTGTGYLAVKKPGAEGMSDKFILSERLPGLEADMAKDLSKTFSSKGDFTLQADFGIRERGLTSLKTTDEVEKIREIQDVIKERSENPEIKKTIMGALLYLDDTQIRNRPGKQSPRYDASSGDGCKGEIKFSFGKKSVHVPVPGMKVANEEGEWANFIHLGPLFLGSEAEGKLPPGIQDSNLFVTAFTSYPLYLFDEKSLPEDKKVIKEMKKRAMKNIRGYKRGDGYNFWKVREGKSSDVKVVSPTNIPGKRLEKINYLLTHKPWKQILSPFTSPLDVAMKEWLELVSDEEKNPYGSDAFFNIPNDADDTSVAVAAEKLHAMEYDPNSDNPYYSNPDNFKVDTEALLKLEDFRDVSRGKSSRFDSWKGENTGAYMTWLKDENLETFKSPETGVIPSAVNLVDEVVNANAVFSMALNGFKDGEGYKDACKLIENAVDEKHWQKVGLYYPQRMIFPYSASRAFRDGGANGAVMRRSMKKLLKDVLEDQANFVKENPDKEGAFPGGFDKTTHLSTALGVIFLLNVGKDVADEAGLGKEYDKAMKDGINYLLKEGKSYKIKNKDTFNRENEEVGKKDKALRWQEGLFFAGDPQNATQWVSEAYTTSMVLEAMGKYAMAYDKGGVSIVDGRKIKINQYSRSSENASQDFDFQIV